MTRPSEDDGVAIHAFDVSQASLDAFRPETTPAGPPNVAAIPSGQSQISLAELKAAGIVFDQSDAVAIGQALCRTFIGSQLRRRMNPRASEPDTSAPMTIESILIDGAGRVKATAGNLDDEVTAVNAIGQVLSEILPDDGRSFLRTKIISKALASPPQFKTVDELSQALKALERPDGREVIRGIFDLWQRESRPVAFAPLSEERPPVVEDPLPVPSEPDVPAEKQETVPPPPSKRRQLVLVTTIVGGGVSALLIGAFVLLNWFRTGPTAAASIPVAPATVNAHAPSEPRPADNKRNDVAFTGPLAPVRQLSAPPPTPAAPRRAVADAPRSVVAPADVSVPMIATASDVSWRPLDQQENRGAPRPDVPASGATAVPSSASRESASIDDLPRTRADAARIYTAKDPDVVPPTPILPRLLAGLHPSTPGIRPDALTVAVLVARDGSVESVRGLVAPRTMGETVLLTEALSVVKSWRFSPATKDGEPVKYEQIVPLTAVIRTAP